MSVNYTRFTELNRNETIDSVNPDEERDSVWYLRVGLYGGGGAIVACMGIICNIITVAVLVNFRTKSSAPFLLSCLAFSDTVYLLFSLLLGNLTELAKKSVIDPSYNSSKIVQGLYSKTWSVLFVSQTLSVYIVVVITLERYVVVCWPFNAKTICSHTSARIAMVGVLVFSILINIPHYMSFTSGWAWHNVTQTEKFYFVRTSFGNSYFFKEIFYKWMQMTFNFIIPLTLLMTFNTLSIVGLRRTRSTLSGNANRRNSGSRLTLMIGCMTTIFFLCSLMAAIGHIIVSGYKSYRDLTNSDNRFVAIADFLMIVNAAVNFAIYCVTGRKFRETFKKMFIPSTPGFCRTQPAQQDTSHSEGRSTCDTKRTGLSYVDSKKHTLHGSSSESLHRVIYKH